MTMATPPEPRIDTSGPRPVIDYMTKDYEGFKQGMLNQIPLLLPEWTDRGESDFGVVLIELFAYVADILSYYQDRVANEAYLGSATQRRSVAELLRLIDYRIDPGLAAGTYLHLGASADAVVEPAHLPYAVRTSGRPGEVDAVFEVTRPFAVRAANSAIALDALSGLPSVPDLPAGATAITLPKEDHALAEHDPIYFERVTPLPDGGRRVRRSPMLIVQAVRELTAGLDEISWLPPLPEPFEAERTVLHGNNVPASHGRTVTDEPVVVADGTPGQRVTLTRSPVTHLLRAGESARRRSRPELEVRVDDVLWEEVDGLFASRPTDLHYVTEIDENDALTVVFGSGARGGIPPAGARITLRYRVGLGGAGNVGPDTLTTAISSVAGIDTVTNPFAATGGAERESSEEAKISGPGSVIAQERAVTIADYDALARGFAGVGKAKARVGLRGGYKVVQVFIAPEAPGQLPPPAPSRELRDALATHLERRMPVNRMAGVDVLEPRYVAVDAAVDVHVQADADRTTVVDAVRRVLSDLLSFPNQDFGTPVRVGEVFSALHPVEGVSYVVLRRLQRRGARPPEEGCEFEDVPIAENELAYEGQLTIVAVGGRP